MRYFFAISMNILLSVIFVNAFGQQNNEPDDLALYYGWLDRESRDSTYHKAYREFKNGPATEEPVPSQHENKTVIELLSLSVAFTKAFWNEKDYDRAFYITFQMEEKLPLVTESEYPDKRRDYLKLGEAYYLMLDNHKSIELLEKAMTPVPASFTDQTNLDALNLIGICYAYISDWQKSENANPYNQNHPFYYFYLFNDPIAIENKPAPDAFSRCETNKIRARA